MPRPHSPQAWSQPSPPSYPASAIASARACSLVVMLHARPHAPRGALERSPDARLAVAIVQCRLDCLGGAEAERRPEPLGGALVTARRGVTAAVQHALPRQKRQSGLALELAGSNLAFAHGFPPPHELNALRPDKAQNVVRSSLVRPPSVSTL